jgi:hypothetical protein
MSITYSRPLDALFSFALALPHLREEFLAACEANDLPQLQSLLGSSKEAVLLQADLTIPKPFREIHPRRQSEISNYLLESIDTVTGRMRSTITAACNPELCFGCCLRL